MKDQYDNDVPSDLVLLPNIEDLTEEGAIVIDIADWYEADGILMASAKAIHYLSEDDPLDAGVDLSKCEIMFVNGILHRYNIIDGFYHA